jgi:non-specific serine/threonine protein kinase
MSQRLFITPAGRLGLEPDSESLLALTNTIATSLTEAFQKSSGEGLLLLASGAIKQELPASLMFARDYARQLFTAICHLGEEGFGQWKELLPPPDEQLSAMVSEAPPMRGLEYLSPTVMHGWWAELRDLVVARAAAHPQGSSGYLREVNPLWHLVGRVTFHLAENKRDQARPFAFLATFAHRLSGQAKVHHLPLADALKSYAAAKDRGKLEVLLEPVRRAAQKSELAKELLENKSLFAPQAWSIRQAYRFLKEAPDMEEAGVVVRLPNWWSARKPPRAQVQVRIGAKKASAVGVDQLLDFDVGMSLDGESLSAEEYQQLMKASDGMVLLRGKWIEVNREQLQEALDHWKKMAEENPDGIGFIQGMRLLAGMPDDKEVPVDQTLSWSRITAGDWLQQTLERLRQPDQIDACQPGRDLQATLRPYQDDGVRWLFFMTELGLGACLADDMGLGKTIQIIDLLLTKKRAGRSKALGPSLIVVPASLLGNWRQELARFAPSLRVLIAHRSECSAELLERLARDPVKELADVNLVLTTYGLARQDEWLQKVNWSLAMLDEAQAIKNPSSAQTRSVKKLQARGRIVLTGTPVENHLGDLWSIFDFCSPGLLGSAKEFKGYVKELNEKQDAKAYGSLRRLVRPYILRRLKTDPGVAPDLPEKTEIRVECGLSKKQAVYYERAVDELADRLKTADGIARRGLVLAMLLQFKQICNHPAQFLGTTDYEPGDSAKFERLKGLCEPIAERQEKMLVFTQFQSLTALLAGYLETVFGKPGLVLHGGTPIKKRSELVKQFQQSEGPPFFVISLKAGGSGLNLTAATHVVHFDRWWNPAVEDQATDRAFRIGQKRNVMVHKFVCRGTIEERIDEMISSKRAVADSVLKGDGETALTEMSNDELLRFVALDVNRARAED